MFKAVIFDWAGTIIDHGSFAPMGVFVKAFAEFDVEVSIADARKPMGLPKWDHIRAMLDDPDIARKWQAAQGAPDDTAVDRIYEIFVPMNRDVVADFADLIPGASDTFAWLAARGIRIGTTTGYTRDILEKVLPRVAAQGFEPASLICADDLPEGRPGPLGIYQSMVNLVAYPPQAIIKVDDTAPGIAEGRAAGCVTVGVTLTGNAAGLTAAEAAALSPTEKQAIRDRVGPELTAAGADHLIDSVADLPALIEKLGG